MRRIVLLPHLALRASCARGRVDWASVVLIYVYITARLSTRMHARPRLGARRQVGLLSPADELWDVTAGVGPLAIRAAKVGCRVRPRSAKSSVRSAAQRSAAQRPLYSLTADASCLRNKRASRGASGNGPQVGVAKWEWAASGTASSVGFATFGVLRRLACCVMARARPSSVSLVSGMSAALP